MSIGKRIRLRRRELGWSQPRLADVSGVAQSSISNIETGRNSSATLDILVPLAQALRVSLDWLANGKDGAEPEDDKHIVMAKRIANLPSGWRKLVEDLVTKAEQKK